MPCASMRVLCLSAASLSRHGCLVSAVYADTSGSGCCSFDGGLRMPKGSVASSGCAPSTRPLLREVMRGAARDRVEVAADHHGNLRRRGDLLQALEQGVDLPEFHVVELGVGVDVGVRHCMSS